MGRCEEGMLSGTSVVAVRHELGILLKQKLGIPFQGIDNQTIDLFWMNISV